MPNLVEQLSTIEKELLALTANQAPNPKQIGVYTAEHTITSFLDTSIIVFPQGMKYWKTFTSYAQSEHFYLFYDYESVSDSILVTALGIPGDKYRVVSLGEVDIEV